MNRQRYRAICENAHENATRWTRVMAERRNLNRAVAPGQAALYAIGAVTNNVDHLTKLLDRVLTLVENDRGMRDELLAMLKRKSGLPESVIDSDAWAVVRCAELRKQGIDVKPYLTERDGRFEVALKFPDGTIERQK